MGSGLGDRRVVPAATACLYVIPMLVLRETWKAADPDVPIGDDRWKRQPVHPCCGCGGSLYGLAPAVFVALSFAGGLRAVGVGNIDADDADIANRSSTTPALSTPKPSSACSPWRRGAPSCTCGPTATCSSPGA